MSHLAPVWQVPCAPVTPQGGSLFTSWTPHPHSFCFSYTRILTWDKHAYFSKFQCICDSLGHSLFSCIPSDGHLCCVVCEVDSDWFYVLVTWLELLSPFPLLFPLLGHAFSLSPQFPAYSVEKYPTRAFQSEDWAPRSGINSFIWLSLSYVLMLKENTLISYYSEFICGVTSCFTETLSPLLSHSRVTKKRLFKKKKLLKVIILREVQGWEVMEASPEQKEFRE